MFFELIFSIAAIVTLTGLTVWSSSLLPLREQLKESRVGETIAQNESKFVEIFRARQRKIALVRRARQERKKEQFQRAEELLYQAVGLDKQDVSIHRELAGLLQERQKLHKAKIIWEKVVELDPSDRHFCDAAEALFLLGRKTQDISFFEQSLEYYQRVMEKAIQPQKRGDVKGFFLIPTEDHERAIAGLAAAYSELNREDEAMVMYENLHRAKEPSKESAFALVELYKKHDRWSEIGNVLSRLRQRYPLDGEVLRAQAEYFFRQKQYHECLEMCEALAKIEMFSRERFRYQGLSAYFLGQYDLAVTSLRKLVELDPETANNHYNLALAGVGLNDFPLAQEHVQRAIDLNTDNPKYHFLQGKVMVLLKKQEEARYAFERVLRLDNEHVSARQELLRMQRKVRVMNMRV